MPLNIQQVASLAGVSRSTVSRVLNNHSGVKAAVRERVLQVIAEQNYAPQAAARSLARTHTDCIGILVPRPSVSVFDPFIATLIQSLFENAAQHGYFAMLAMLTADREAGFYERILRGRHFDGLVMFSSDIDDPILPLLIRDGNPLVLIGRHPYFDNVTSVDAENREGARDAVMHLIERGHRRIGLINGQLEMEAAQARRDGYKQALLEHGIPIESELMVEGFYSQIAAYEAMEHLLDLPRPPTGVFCASDSMALGALNAARNRGLRVPDEVALVGFDDLPLAAYATPPLTTMRQPLDEMSQQAVRLLIEQIRGHDVPKSVRFPARLVVRASSGEPAADEVTGKGGGFLRTLRA
jgi:DNA-binding LacI/PurR family transcriptional regulator